ncbi:MAG: hypothetical protein GXO13_00945 [Epsilonproteobacteria bacterium]|nr:hypothetical protein [Campylobacterota bacterium]
MKGTITKESNGRVKLPPIDIFLSLLSTAPEKLASGKRVIWSGKEFNLYSSPKREGVWYRVEGEGDLAVE